MKTLHTHTQLSFNIIANFMIFLKLITTHTHTPKHTHKHSLTCILQNLFVTISKTVKLIVAQAQLKPLKREDRMEKKLKKKQRI